MEQPGSAIGTSAFSTGLFTVRSFEGSDRGVHLFRTIPSSSVFLQIAPAA
jgi:hypothetical protein